MTTHIKAFTYQDKIPGVLDGSIRQTIRAIRGKREIKAGDKILFHGWEGRPYWSKWSWRKEVEVSEVIDIIIYPEGIAFAKIDGDSSYYPWDSNKVILKTIKSAIRRIYPWDSNTVNFFAAEDGIVPATGLALHDVLVKLNGPIPPTGMAAQVIRW